MHQMKLLSYEKNMNAFKYLQVKTPNVGELMESLDLSMCWKTGEGKAPTARVFHMHLVVLKIRKSH